MHHSFDHTSFVVGYLPDFVFFSLSSKFQEKESFRQILPTVSRQCVARRACRPLVCLLLRIPETFQQQMLKTELKLLFQEGGTPTHSDQISGFVLQVQDK